jgi:hypothetical protein
MTSRTICDQIKENGIWKPRCNLETYKLYNEPDILKLNKKGQLKWLGKLFRIQEHK